MAIEPDVYKMILDGLFVHPYNEPPLMVHWKDIVEFEGEKHLEILITPIVIRSDQNIKALSHADRSCYFEGEKKLRFFRVYTKRNCEIECFSNSSRQACNCVPFHVVRDSDTTVCSVLEEDCIWHFQREFKFHGTEKSETCSCLSVCDSVSYAFEVRESKFQKNS